MRSAARWLLPTLAVLEGVLRPVDGLACAVCVGPTREDLGLYWSTLFLMAVPVGMAGLIGGWLYYSHRRSAGGGRGGAARRPLTLTRKESGR